jgi:tetratricopeptide (TPR) repeat protein
MRDTPIISACSFASKRKANKHIKRGLKYSKQGKHEKAIEEFTNAINLDPTNPSGYCGRGTSYFNLLKGEEALVDFAKAINIAPIDSPLILSSYVSCGCVLHYLGKYEDAITEFTKALNIAQSMNFSDCSKSLKQRLKNEQSAEKTIATCQTAILGCQAKLNYTE